ncbi:MAG: M20/M25/M40 family metallo-hydrolase [Candidatus Eiseniibacteriota bacterium]
MGALPGIPGHEGSVASAVAQAFALYADRVDRDRAGNVRAWIHGTADSPRPRALLAAHMDRIGFLVKSVEPGGFLRVTELGGFDPRTLFAKEVLIHSKPPIVALFGTRPPHLQKPGDSERVLPLSDFYLDTGRPEAEVRRRVPIGTPVTLRQRPVSLMGGRLAAPGMDDRSGIVVLLRTLESLSRARPAWDVVAVATVEEEFGMYCLGAKTATEALDPQLGIAVDVFHGDMPGAPLGEAWPLGGGPALGVGANIHPKVLDGLRRSARDLAMPFQVEGCPMTSGTDAMDIQIARQGVPTAVVGIPCRYMHTGIETVEPRDVDRCAHLLAHYLGRLPAEWRATEVLK